MAIKTFPTSSPSDVNYAKFVSSSGLYWNGTALESYAASNLANYAIPATAVSIGSLDRQVTIPPGLPSGIYTMLPCIRNGFAPAEADDEGDGITINWGGTFEVGPSQIVTPSGYTNVDHNFGGSDALTVKDINGVPIAGALIQALLASDYTAHGAAATVLQWTTSNLLGHWNAPLPLVAGNSYAILFSATNDQPMVRTIST